LQKLLKYSCGSVGWATVLFLHTMDIFSLNLRIPKFPLVQGLYSCVTQAVRFFRRRHLAPTVMGNLAVDGPGSNPSKTKNPRSLKSLGFFLMLGFAAMTARS